MQMCKRKRKATESRKIDLVIDLPSASLYSAPSVPFGGTNTPTYDHGSYRDGTEWPLTLIIHRLSSEGLPKQRNEGGRTIVMFTAS